MTPFLIAPAMMTGRADSSAEAVDRCRGQPSASSSIAVSRKGLNPTLLGAIAAMSWMVGPLPVPLLSRWLRPPATVR